PRVLLLGHHDTVWPLGTLARWPFSADGDVATGPGCFDMKAGLVQTFHALAALDSFDGVAVLVTGDEEIGSPTSADLIVESASGVDATLVTEPSSEGALKIARKGTRQYILRTTGRAAHAGLEPHNGVNAGVELAHQIVAVSDIDLPADTTLTPTVSAAGTTSNTVPGAASVYIDVRSFDEARFDTVEEQLEALLPQLPGASLELEHGPRRPPMPPSSSQTLFALATHVASDLGLPPLDGVAVGGASDGNLTASAGISTLDGLGAVGGNAHAEGEWVDLSAMGDRTALLHGMVQRILAGEAHL
ncbi:MAG: M20/M25/M40 family metallo-hydrolase, partial [Micromonosporaceae bacterium]|nr:M20/M25/M40 family metallo-hydrolase [Micromonosporaceae bacterium]